MDTQISISEAARRWGVSRQTIHNKIKSGELSVSGHGQVKAGQAKKLDIAELQRVLGNPSRQVETVKEADSGQVEAAALQGQLDLAKAEIQSLKSQLSIREEQITDFREQVKRLQPVPLLEQLKKMWSK